mgnify:CR=1 FL=1
MLMHQILPHVHHQHPDSITQIEDAHHHHDGESHHHQNGNENGDEKGLLNLLLGGHSHLVQIDEIHFFRTNQKQANKIIKSVAAFVVPKVIVSTIDTECFTQALPPNESPPWRHFLGSHSLRGPPTLG